MRIQHNIMAMNANRNLTMNNSKLAKNLEKLSSGYRINRAGDDAAGLAISEKMRAQIAVLDQSQNNANDGIAMLQTAEGAMTEIHDMLNRMETLATQAANGTYDATAGQDLDQINKEYNALIDEIDRIAKTSQFNGVSLMTSANGAAADVKFQVGYGEGNTLTMELSKLDMQNTALSNALTTDFIKDNATNDKMVELMDAVKTAVQTVSGYRADLGAMQNRLEHTVNNLGVMQENLQNAESTIRDTNVADEMMAYTKNNILIQSAQAMLAQANQVPQGVLQLMQ